MDDSTVEASYSPDSTLLLSYHDTLGHPTPPVDPPKLPPELGWSARYKLERMLGRGAQGVVYLAQRDGVDGYSTKVAVKLFLRHESVEPQQYLAEMRRIAQQAQQISVIQHDNLIDIRDFVSINETRVMVMEWVDGLDLNELLDLGRYWQLKKQLSIEDWEHLNDTIVGEGEDHCRLRPGVAVDVLHGCLAGLSSLHHHGIIHSDLKPSNIMIKRTGTTKLIDMDSSCDRDETVIRGTPYYMAPEQLTSREVRYRSDIASLGYVLIEMITGKSIFKHCQSVSQLVDAKSALPSRLESLFPPEIRDDDHLFGLCAKMIAPEADKRFVDAEAADLGRLGAARFLRDLVVHGKDADYHRELAWWVDLLHPLESE